MPRVAVAKAYEETQVEVKGQACLAIASSSRTSLEGVPSLRVSRPYVAYPSKAWLTSLDLNGDADFTRLSVQS